MSPSQIFSTPPLFPAWISLSLLGALVAAVIFGVLVLAQRGIDWRWNAFLAGVRLLAIAVFALILFPPHLTFNRSRVLLPELVVLVDGTGSMNAADRWSKLTAELDDGELGRTLRERFQIRQYTFDSKARSLKNGPFAAIKPEGKTTLLAESLQSLFAQEEAQGRKPRHILLASDGIDQSLNDPLTVAVDRFAKIDVLAPPAGSRPRAARVEIVRVQSPPRVLLGSETPLRVTIRNLPATARKVTLKLMEEGKTLLEKEETLTAGKSEQSLDVALRPVGSGLHTYEVAISSADAEAGPAHKHAVQVLDQKYEILILEDTWRWEYKYLQQVVDNDPSFRFTAMLPRGRKTFSQFASPDRRVTLTDYPENPADLEAFDVFILGDAEVSKWKRGLASALARLVHDEGKSLVVIAGPRLGTLATIREFDGLLPVRLTTDSGKPIEAPAESRLRPDAADSPFFFKLPGGTDNLALVDRIYPVQGKTPQATVLIEAREYKKEKAQPYILLAEHTVGKGRVLFVGTDTLYKWHTMAAVGEAVTPYTVFWQQALRALTPTRPLLGPVQIWLTPLRSKASVGGKIAVEAEIQTRQKMEQPILKGSVTLPDGSLAPLVFVADPADALRYRTEFVSEQVGMHTVSAQLMLEGKISAKGTVLVEFDEPTSETEPQDADRAGLLRLAEGTGGSLIDLTSPETWPVAAGASQTQIERDSIDLWNNGTLLLLLVGLLAIDWFGRLWRGLV